MSTLAAKGSMFYCPKCKTKYEDGSQRFCNEDGGRLLPAISGSKATPTAEKKVFTSLLGRTAPKDKRDEKLAERPRHEKAAKKAPNFELPAKSKVFKTEEKVKTPHRGPKKKKVPVARPEAKTHRSTPVSKVVRANEVLNEQAKAEIKKEESGKRDLLTWQNPRALLGQTIKGRYLVADILNQDQTSIAYLAEDKIINGKRVTVRVLMNETQRDSFQEKILSEERVSLSHINHPNIVGVIDSGDLLDGKPFVITEYIAGKSVSEVLGRSGQLNPMRTARIVRKASLALSEVHQSGILHRNLKPEHILLFVSDAGIEQVKVTDFSVSDGKPRIDNLGYKSPEQLSRKTATFASDSYSLAVIAYQMLCGQLPYTARSERELLKAQKQGLKVLVSDVRSEMPAVVDQIFVKALSYNPSDRYPKARDFGEALFNALTTESPWEDPAETEIPATAKLGSAVESEKIGTDAIDVDRDDSAVAEKKSESDVQIAPKQMESDSTDAGAGAEKNLAASARTESGGELWKNRSPEPIAERGWLWTLSSILGLLLLAAAAVWSIVYFYTQDDQPVAIVPQNQADPNETRDPTIQKGNEISNASGDIEVPPPAREIKQPPNTEFFENSKQNLSPELARNYRGFSLYYPTSWVKAKTSSNFLDIKSETKDGLPKEQMVITRYESTGTYGGDKARFSELVEKSNADLKELLPKYQVVSEGSIKVNNGWKAYEVKFNGRSEIEGGENFEIWGRRIWIPAARPGVKNGFVITMLATSLSDKVEGLDDVGTKGELGDILYTFEPDQDYD